jgi:hypothetical protein
MTIIKDPTIKALLRMGFSLERVAKFAVIADKAKVHPLDIGKFIINVQDYVPKYLRRFLKGVPNA